MNNTINISRKDVIWNYAATFLQIGVGVLLLPFILRVFPQETVAVWTIFTTIIALTGLLDFGFNPSFARNVSYVVSGVKELKTTGYHVVENHSSEIDYSLFKGLINAMRWFYARAAVILFVLLASAGTCYIHMVLETYSGSHTEVYIAWGILVAINSYSLYTMYYDSLMQGKGLIKRSKQIKIVGQSVYLAVAVALILLRFNLIAVVSAQALSIVIIRILSYRTIYTPAFKRLLQGVQARARKEILKPIYPNAIKVGLTILGGGLVLRASTIVGSLYLSLDDIASYGITIQIIMIISSIASVYFTTYQPKIVQYRVQNDNLAIKQLYLRGCLLLFCTFLLGGAVLVFLGEWAMNVIGSQTPLLSKSFILAALLIYLLETNHANAGGILLTKNEVPYFKASLFSGAFTVILLFVFLMYTDFGVWGLLLAQGIAQGCYQNWKWPLEVVKELCVKRKDMYSIPLKTTTFNFALFQWKKRKKDQEAQRLNDLRKDIINYLQTVPPAGMTDEYQAVLDYLTHHPLSVFPYSYTGKYNPEDIVVYLDAEKKMRYILQDGKRLYFRKGWDEKQVQAYYNGLLIEQDSCSPHCYETAGFHVSEGDVVVDAGAAEGNFALSVIDKVKKIYLFEVDKKWIAALKATFAPWKEKVTIVNKYVSDNDKKNCITLDTFFGNEQIDFIKADIEGAECQLLAGAKKILSGQTPMNVVLCTYHKHDDAEVLNEMLVEKGFRTEISKGYMIFLYETYDKLKPPYLRRGLLRGIRMGKQVKE